MEKNDEVLVQKFKEGNAEAFQRLFEKYKRRVYKMVYLMLWNKEDSEDITQEAFFQVYKSIQTLRENRSFYSWLYNIALNLSTDHIRRKKGVRFLSLSRQFGGSPETLDIEIADWSKNSAQLFQKKETRITVRKAVESLSPKYRMVLILKYFQDLSYEEIAQTLRCPVGTVRSRIHNAKRRLEQILKL